MTRTEILKTAKPILFGTEMVRAIQDGRKTVTRRRIKQSVVDRFMLSNDERLLGSFDDKCYDIYPTVDDAPYQVDDILYVRETWCKGCIVGSKQYLYVSQGEMSDIIFKEECLRNHIGVDDVVWRPSIHMPKEAARLFLRVTDVRVERLQDITKDGRIAEGAETDEYLDYEEWVTAVAPPGSRMITLRDYFSELWNSTVKKSNLSKYGWDANPWVWVI